MSRRRAEAVSGMPPASEPWTTWIAGLGHDTYSYPLWITEQQLRCRCDVTLSTRS